MCVICQYVFFFLSKSVMPFIFPYQDCHDFRTYKNKYEYNGFLWGHPRYKLNVSDIWYIPLYLTRKLNYAKMRLNYVNMQISKLNVNKIIMYIHINMLHVNIIITHAYVEIIYTQLPLYKVELNLAFNFRTKCCTTVFCTSSFFSWRLND